jgi:hypothetical protein
VHDTLASKELDRPRSLAGHGFNSRRMGYARACRRALG